MEGSHMLQNVSASDAAAPFHILGAVKTVAAIPNDDCKHYIPGNLARGHPKLHTLPGWKTLKGDAPLALIGGGPSLADTLEELKDFPVTMCAGSTHDWLIEHGHIPTFCTIADPDPVCANYIRRAHPDVEYLVATQCHPSVYEALEGKRIRTWHLWPCDEEFLVKHDPTWEAVGGGCTVGLRNVSIAVMMGFKNVHFFGYDSCYGETRSHVQDFSQEGEEAFLGDTYNVSVNFGTNGPGEKVFRCAGYMMAQAQHFKEMLCEYGNIIEPTFHGSGLLPEYARMYKALRDLAIAKLTEENSK